MPVLKNIDPARWFLPVLALSVFSYVVSRAYCVGITHDEAFTFNWYVPQSFWQIITYDVFPNTPNNHILNTVLVKLSTLPGQHPFWLRLPTLLFFGVFLWAALRWLLDMKQSWLAIPSMVLLVGNPYLLDFFGLARGYGMGLTLLFLACLALFRYTQQPKPGLVWGMFLAGLLCVVANSILLHFYAALGLVFGLATLVLLREKAIPSWKQWWQHVLPAIGLTLLLALIMARPLEKIAHSGQLTGGDSGFWEDTVKSLVHQSLYDQPYAAATEPWADGLVALISVVLLSLFLVLLFREGVRAWRRPFVLVSAILVISIATMIAQHLVFQSPYVRERMGLFYLVLFSIACITGLQIAGERVKTVAAAAALIPTVLLAVHLVNCANTRFALEWRYDCNTLEMLRYLDTEVHQKSPDKPVLLGVSPVFTPSVNFYRSTRGFDWLPPAHVDGFEKEKSYNWAYILPSDLENETRRLNGKVIKTFEPSGALLAR